LKFGFFGLQNSVFGSVELKRAENVENCVSSFFWVGGNVEIILSVHIAISFYSKLHFIQKKLVSKPFQSRRRRTT
jgi:hypothetical protein